MDDMRFKVVGLALIACSTIGLSVDFVRFKANGYVDATEEDGMLESKRFLELKFVLWLLVACSSLYLVVQTIADERFAGVWVGLFIISVQNALSQWFDMQQKRRLSNQSLTRE